MPPLTRRSFLLAIPSFAAACRATGAIRDAGAEPTTCGPLTAPNIEGPFYLAGAPHHAVLVQPRDRGERFVLTGTVTSAARCTPLANAELDIWYADADGAYDNAGYHFRGMLRTDARGRFELRTIVPGHYLNGPRYRPAHIHVKLRARGHDELTTQLYFAGDPFNEGDPFIEPPLIMSHRRAGGIRRARFDFTLA